MITKTEDYSIFNKSNFNRDLKERNVVKIMRSLAAKNLLKNRPILVDVDLNVIDGQHRLEAAKRLNIPVWYEVQNDLQPEDIVLLNDNQALWDNLDYLKFHVEKGLQDYIKLDQFMKEHQISLSTAFAVLGYKNTRRADTGTSTKNLFKAGLYKFPTNIEQLEAVEILNKTNDIIGYIKPKLQGNNNYLSGPHFRRALYVFLSIRAVEFDVFMKNLGARLDLIRPCSRIGDFVSIFKQIYNFRNRNPITFDEFAQV